MKIIEFKMHYIDDLVDIYNKTFNWVKYTKKEVLDIIAKRQLNYLLLDKHDIVVGFLNGRVIDTKSDSEISKYILSDRVLIVSNIGSIAKGGGTMLINYLDKYNLDVFLVSHDDKLISFYNKVGFVRVKSKRRFMIKYKYDTESLLNRKKRVVVIKGNQKYEITKKLTKKFYNTISTVVNKVYKDVDVTFVESGIKHGELCENLKEGDVVIGFSRGGSYATIWKKYCNNKAYFININSNDYNDANEYISNPLDKTSDGNFDLASLTEHWTIDNKMKHELEYVLKSYYKETNN